MVEEIEVDGLLELSAVLDAAPRRIVENAFARALAAAAVPVSRALDSRTPEHTGDLKEHKVTDIAIDSQGRGGIAQIGFGKAGWKARLVETGHRIVGHEPDKKETGVVVPHPFMGPAAAESAEQSVEAFAETLDASLQGDMLQRAS